MNTRALEFPHRRSRRRPRPSWRAAAWTAPSARDGGSVFGSDGEPRHVPSESAGPVRRVGKADVMRQKTRHDDRRGDGNGQDNESNNDRSTE